VPGPEDEEMLQEFLESMMGQLMSKEVLYEPLKELTDKVSNSPSCSDLYPLIALSIVPILSGFEYG